MQNALVCLCMSCVTGNVQLQEERTEVGCVDCEVEVKVHFNEWGCTVWEEPGSGVSSRMVVDKGQYSLASSHMYTLSSQDTGCYNRYSAANYAHTQLHTLLYSL